MLLTELNNIKAQLLIATKVSVRKDWWDRFLATEWVYHSKGTETALSFIYGVPLSIIDDPLAPDWVIEYRDKRLI